jgi:hypothetical protein
VITASIVETPTIAEWTLENGAIMFGGRKYGSAVLAYDPIQKKTVILVQGADVKQREMLDLDQPELLDLIFQMVAAYSGEYYRIDCTSMVKTDVDHVWHNQVNRWYYYFDETDAPVGPFGTKEIAKERLDWYCKHILGA